MADHFHCAHCNYATKYHHDFLAHDCSDDRIESLENRIAELEERIERLEGDAK